VLNIGKRRKKGKIKGLKKRYSWGILFCRSR
jgi:hypothetical protein